MGVIATQVLTLKDWADSIDPMGKPAVIVNTLTKYMPMLEDVIFIESNLPTGHQSTILTGLPDVTWRRAYQTVQPSKSTRTTVTDTIGNVESCSELDEDIAKLNGQTKEFRLQHAKPHMVAIAHALGETFFYGNTTQSPELFTGLAPRYNQLSNDEQNAGFNIIDAGGTGGDNTSIWFVNHSKETTFMFFPKGQSLPSSGATDKEAGKLSYVGVEHRDQTPNEPMLVYGADGGKFHAFVDWFKAKMGLAVRDWRYNVRIANIDKSVIDGMGNENYAGPDLINLMIRAVNKIEDLNTGKTVIYVNRDVMTAIDLNMANKKSVAAFSWAEIQGERVRMFREFPIKMCNAILNTEQRVV